MLVDRGSGDASACESVGVPDETRGEQVKVFLVLQQGHQASETLVREIQGYVKTRLARHEYPREVEFLAELPMTATGKIMCRELREKKGGPKAGSAC